MYRPIVRVSSSKPVTTSKFQDARACRLSQNHSHRVCLAIQLPAESIPLRLHPPSYLWPLSLDNEQQCGIHLVDFDGRKRLRFRCGRCLLPAAMSGFMSRICVDWIFLHYTPDRRSLQSQDTKTLVSTRKQDDSIANHTRDDEPMEHLLFLWLSKSSLRLLSLSMDHQDFKNSCLDMRQIEHRQGFLCSVIEGATNRMYCQSQDRQSSSLALSTLIPW